MLTIQLFQVFLLHIICLQYLLSCANFFAWIALDSVDLYFSLILVTKANAVEGATASAM